MSIVKRNIVANFAGQGWAALMSFIFIPLYIKFLGIEAYGLIGFFAMMQGTLVVLDLGLSQTMNRELARYSVLPDKAAEARDLARTLEIGYWVVGLLIGAAVLVASPLIASHWIKAGSLPVSTIQRTVMIMGVVAALQWPVSFYGGGLMGLQRQMQINIVRIGISTLASGGAVLIMWLVSPTITAFFTWQIIVSVVNVSVMIMLLWRSLPDAGRPARFNPDLMRTKWRFAAGMTGISLSAIILTQLDKLILSKMLSLEMFGYYVLAFTVCNVIPTMLVGPVFNALFPKFSSLVALNDEAELIRLYHQGTQLMAVIVLPVALVIAFFSYDILLLWTGVEITARTVSPIVSILIIGMALNSLMTLPYALQLSHGWTSIGLRINTFLIITLVPAIYYMTTHYGALGAAAIWVTLNIIYMVIGVPLTHHRLLRSEMRRWFLHDIMPPFTATIIVVSAGAWLMRGTVKSVLLIGLLGSVTVASFIAAVLSAQHTRVWLFGHLFKAKTANA
jgi:O-antigen/teichoic acid export membrane protein